MACNKPTCLNCRVNAVLDEFFPGGVSNKGNAVRLLTLARDIAGAVLSDPRMHTDSIASFFTAVRINVAERRGENGEPEVTKEGFGDSLQDLIAAAFPQGVGVDEMEIALPVLADLLGFMFSGGKNGGEKTKAAFYRMVEHQQGIHEQQRRAVRPANDTAPPSTETLQ